MRRLLYFSPSWSGGLADYAHEQANALITCCDIPVEVLAPPAFRTNRGEKYSVSPALFPSTVKVSRKSRWQSRLSTASTILKNIETLVNHIARHKYKHVLFGSYSEYLAPFWAGQLRKLAQQGIVFGSIIHDPVRNYRVGPLWWHRRSIAAAYSFLREAFVHEPIQLDTVTSMPSLRTTVIPHGAYHFPAPTESRAEVRERLKLPQTAKVFLSFGHIRDGKNLDLAIRAMVNEPSTYLIVAGKELSLSQKPVHYYQNLAQELQVADRCRWIHGFIPEEDVGNLFAASDVVLLTYNQEFHSASGVLNAAVCYRKPCLASSGGSNLRSVVEKYRLGWFVEPDCLEALKQGLRLTQESALEPQWEKYDRESSWERNALIVAEQMFGEPRV